MSMKAVYYLGTPAPRTRGFKVICDGCGSNGPMGDSKGEATFLAVRQGGDVRCVHGEITHRCPSCVKKAASVKQEAPANA